MSYRKSYDEIFEIFNSNIDGLTEKDAKQKLKENGFNELNKQKRLSIFKLLFDSFTSPLVIILLIAVFVQILMGEMAESVIILIVVFLNAILEVVQSKKAESSLESLKKLSAPNAKVIRDKKKLTIPARELVEGDVVILDAGDFVPADGRIIEAKTLKIVEGMLTGEAEPVLKHNEVIFEEVSIGDRKNMVFSGSMVVYGRGLFVVTNTGMNTEVGKIAGMIENAENKKTPLQIKLEVFSKKLGLGILILSILIFVIHILRAYFFIENANMTKVLFDSFMFSIAVAVAAIPEALSSIVTIVLAVGTSQMAKKNAIIRKLPAVETLGSTSIICTDKTGTLTQNKMTVVDFFMSGIDKKFFKKDIIDNFYQAKMLNFISVLSNDSHINKEGKEIGDPTELALILYSDRHIKLSEEIKNENKRIFELPFDSDRKIMTTFNEIDGKVMMMTKGAPDVIFNRCKYVMHNNEILNIEENSNILDEYKKQNESFSNRALRVLAFAMKEVNGRNFSLDDEYDLTLVGLIAMIDPPRKEVMSAIREAKHAGIKTIMITGDHKTTAIAIAKDLGIINHPEIGITGAELDEMSDDRLDDMLEYITVYARVSPENKIRIVKAWQKKNKITAMTGDGVNDAPALKQADIGIGMGSGTEVAKDASAMILVDDNFASIVNAIEVGRTIFENIKKSIIYLFAGNLGAIVAILFAVFANWPNPFTALQLLFINLINDSLPAIALGFEKPEKNIMFREPRETNDNILDKSTLKIVLMRGLIIGFFVIFAQFLGLRISTEMGMAMAFSTLIIARILQTFPSRSNEETAKNLGFFSNKLVILAVIVCFSLYFLIFIPFLRIVFSIPESFGIKTLLICVFLGIISTLFMEILKMKNSKIIKR